MRILVADDHGVIREMLRDMVERKWPDAEIVDTETMESHLLPDFKAQNFDLALVDYHIPGISSVEAVSHCVEFLFPCRVVIISSETYPTTVKNLLRSGISGFIPKQYKRGPMIAALELILSGEIFVPALVLNESQEPFETASYTTDSIEQSLELHLTDGEIEILDMIMRGLTNKVIAQNISRAEITVKQKVRKIYDKIGASNRSEATLIWREIRLGKRQIDKTTLENQTL